MTMKRRDFIRNSAVGAAAVLMPYSSKAAQTRPNVLFILADDLGFSDLGCYGGEIQTPVLDGLAGRGLRYSQFYNTGRCWPSRTALLTGYYPQQIGRDAAPGIKGGNSGKRPPWAPLLPGYLKKAGYRCYHSGKWHIDGSAIKGGFDHSYCLNDHDRFHSPKRHTEDDQQLAPVERGTGHYCTSDIASRAIKYLKEHETEHKEKPFFAFVAFTSPHFPLHALPQDIARIGDRYAPGWDAIRQRRWERIQALGLVKGRLSEVERDLGPPAYRPESYEILGENEVLRPVPWDSLTAAQKEFQQTKMTLHAAMVERMDRDIGRVLDQVRSMGAFEDTLIMFMSDNGTSAEILVRGDGHDHEAAPGSAGSYLCLGPGWSTSCNTPFRKHKTWVHEGGTHTPFIVHWPMGIRARGELRHDPGHIIDLFPTVMKVTGAGAPDPAPVPLPGRSLAPTFAADTHWPRELWWHHAGHSAMRVDDWKITAVKDGKWELFDLAVDPTESKDLAAARPEKLRSLEAAWDAMLAEFKKVTPKPREG